MAWTVEFQRSLLAAAIEGRLGQNPDILRPALFHDSVEPVARAIREFRKEHGLWPGRKVLPEIVHEDDLHEAKKVAKVGMDQRVHAEAEGRVALRHRALEEFFVQGAEFLDHPEVWDKFPAMLSDALRCASRAPDPYRYGEGIQERHAPEKPITGVWRAPTGIEPFDRAMGGGLAQGELGLIMAPSKRGKSHMGVWFGSRAVLAGRKVLHITLELRDRILARRYDRCFSDMDAYAIEENPDELERRVREAVPDPEALQIVSAPRYSLSVSDVAEVLEAHTDRWGERPVLVVDYGSILRYDRTLPRHQALGRVHEELSSLAMERTIPIWTPFQSNRQGLSEAGDSLGLEHAGDSFEAMQHADVIMTMNQSKQDRTKGRMRLDLTGMRDGHEAQVIVTPDWSRSRLEVHAA